MPDIMIIAHNLRILKLGSTMYHLNVSSTQIAVDIFFLVHALSLESATLKWIQDRCSCRS